MSLSHKLTPAGPSLGFNLSKISCQFICVSPPSLKIGLIFTNPGVLFDCAVILATISPTFKSPLFVDLSASPDVAFAWIGGERNHRLGGDFSPWGRFRDLV
jgi:hypothetical protein